MRRSASLCLLPLLAACAAAPTATRSTPAARTPAAGTLRVPGQVPPTRPQAPAPTGFRAARVMALPGLEGVIGADKAGLVRQFGDPRLDVWEGDARKLQFTGSACVLDIYLYPPRAGAEPVATYVDARRPSDALDVDRVACVNALKR